MRGKRLYDEDMLSDTHFPVQVAFNSISDSRFMEILLTFEKVRGFGFEYGSCLFPDDLKEFGINEDFKVVDCGLHSGDEIRIDYSTFYYYLDKVCKRYIKEKPIHILKVNKILRRIKENLNV